MFYHLKGQVLSLENFLIMKTEFAMLTDHDSRGPSTPILNLYSPS